MGGQGQAPRRFTPSKDLVLIVWVAGRAPGAVSPPTGIRSSERPTRSESLYRLSDDDPQGNDDNLQIRQVSWCEDRKRELYLIFRSVRDLQIH